MSKESNFLGQIALLFRKRNQPYCMKCACCLSLRNLEQMQFEEVDVTNRMGAPIFIHFPWNINCEAARIFHFCPKSGFWVYIRTMKHQLHYVFFQTSLHSFCSFYSLHANQPSFRFCLFLCPNLSIPVCYKHLSLYQEPMYVSQISQFIYLISFKIISLSNYL